MEKPFNVYDWLPKEAQPIPPVNELRTNETTIELDIDRIVDLIEKDHIDLTADYKDWLTIGFAFASELGEMGRSYFHRISRFYAGYDQAKTDKQYDSCLKGNNNKVSIKSFFFLAKQANIALTKPVEPLKKKEAETPIGSESPGYTGTGLIEEIERRRFTTSLLPESVYENLPAFLNDCVNLFSPGIERDIILLSCITVLSGCLPKIEGTYFNKRLSPHLYLFITGPSASGKGTMNWSRYLGQSIHAEMHKNSLQLLELYYKELEGYENLPAKQRKAMEKPVMPFRKMLYIPANSSSAALTQLLSENDFTGIIFESEADTLSNTAKQDWGDSSDIFRKAFHHENTGMARRLNKEIIEITNPHLAICLSGTPKQVINLMPDVENGLFSRFMYYAFEDNRGFINPFESYSDLNYEDFFTSKGYEVHHFYNKLKKLSQSIDFKLTKKQGQQFTIYFQSLLEKNKLLLTRDLDANTKRLGVITYRIAMVLSVLRVMQAEIGTVLPKTLLCNDDDFNTALVVASELEKHAIAVFTQMPKVNLKGKRLTFYMELPLEFDRKTYLTIGKKLGISENYADKMVCYFKAKILDYKDHRFFKKIGV